VSSRCHPDCKGNDDNGKGGERCHIAPRYKMMKAPIIADRKAIFLLKRIVLTVLQN